jgi:hypothetical protein
MTNKPLKQSLKAALIGAFAGAMIFFALDAVKAQANLTVAQIEQNSKMYVGTTVQVTGMVSSVRSSKRNVNGYPTPYVMLNLYKVDAKGRKANRYVYVALPATSFQTMPIEGQMMAITGPLKWGYEIAAIDP